MLGLTVHLPLYYEVVYHLSASESGAFADPAWAAVFKPAAAAIRRAGPWPVQGITSGWPSSETHARRWRGLAPGRLRRLAACGRCLRLLSVFALGLGTTFPGHPVGLDSNQNGRGTARRSAP